MAVRSVCRGMKCGVMHACERLHDAAARALDRWRRLQKQSSVIVSCVRMPLGVSCACRAVATLQRTMTRTRAVRSCTICGVTRPYCMPWPAFGTISDFAEFLG